MKNVRVLQFLTTLSLALIGAGLFLVLHIPLPWVLGPLAAVMTWNLLVNKPLYWPNGFQHTALIIFGYMLGRSFTRETAWQVVHQLPSILFATVLMIGFSLLLGFVVAKLAGVGVESAVFGSVPGGLSQMVLLGENFKEVNVTVVTLMQSIRLISVVMVVPFLSVHGVAEGDVSGGIAEGASFWDMSALLGYPLTTYLLFVSTALLGASVGRRLGMPLPALTGPLTATALVVLLGVEAPPLPPLLITVPQLLLGTYLGLRMQPQDLPNARKLSLLTVASSLLLIVFCLLLGWVLSALNPISFVTGFLSVAPGGMAEMGATAVQVHADLSMMSGYQFFRLFFIMFAVPPLLTWWMKKRRIEMN